MKLLRVAFLCFTVSLMSSCAAVDQYGKRAYDGNLNNQSAINQEVLANIIRASKFESLSWNPVSQVTGSQNEALTTGLPTINIGPGQTAAQHIYSLSNSLSSSVAGGYSTTPLTTTGFQAGMITPVDLKTMAELSTVYPREVIFYALVAAIDLRLVGSHYSNRLVNDPAYAYAHEGGDRNLDQNDCDPIFPIPPNKPRDPFALLFQRNGDNLYCSYAKFMNLMRILIDYGLYVDLVQVPGSQAGQQTPASLLSAGVFCVKPSLTDLNVKKTSLPICGAAPKQDLGSVIVSTTTATNKDEFILMVLDGLI